MSYLHFDPPTLAFGISREFHPGLASFLSTGHDATRDPCVAKHLKEKENEGRVSVRQRLKNCARDAKLGRVAVSRVPEAP